MHSNLAPLILTKRIKYQKYHIPLRHRSESRKKKIVVVLFALIRIHFIFNEINLFCANILKTQFHLSEKTMTNDVTKFYVRHTFNTFDIFFQKS